MNAWQRLTLPAGTDADAAIKELLASGQVVDAYVAPDVAPPPQVQTPPTPDFTSMQAKHPSGRSARISARRPFGSATSCNGAHPRRRHSRATARRMANARSGKLGSIRPAAR